MRSACRASGRAGTSPCPPAALAYAEHLIPDSQPTLVISACSSHALRNWSPERYAAVADHAANQHGMRVILCGGPSTVEREMAEAILQVTHACRCSNQVGKDTLPQLLALLGRATVLLTPDSGPAHMATMVNTPVIGLYAATNPERSGPYLSRRWCVNAYRCGGAEIHGQDRQRAALDHQDRTARGHGSDRSTRRHRQAR